MRITQGNQGNKGHSNWTLRTIALISFYFPGGSVNLQSAIWNPQPLYSLWLNKEGKDFS
jgi:hypothetical protein